MLNLNYRKSNKILCIHFGVSARARYITQKILASDSAERREKLSVALCDELCDLAEIDICDVCVEDEHQKHKKSKGRLVYKQYGFYKTREKEITIHNRTAVRGQVLAAKTFLNTLLHEWVHHYDTYKLRLNSVHTKGFYLRLKSLEDQLRKVII